MISSIKGILELIEEDLVIVDVNGIGFGVYMPVRAMNMLGPIGSEVKIYTYLHVREDVMQLFGFMNRDDLMVFKLLLGVSGIGPKGALGVLSEMSADDLRFAVLSDDVKAISAAPGIGKKTAQKLILELKDKLKLEDALSHTMTEGDSAPVSKSCPQRSEAIEALQALGYGASESLKAVNAIGDLENLTTEEILKQALRNMMS